MKYFMYFEKSMRAVTINCESTLPGLIIMATILITSLECERSISLLRLIKTSLRSTMGQDRLNGLAILQCHLNTELTPEEQ